MYSIPQMVKSVAAATQDNQRWKINTAGPLVEKLIHKEFFYENVFVIVNIIFATYSGISHVIPDESDKDFFLILTVFERFFPRFERLLTVMFRMSCVMVPIIIMVPFYMSIYYAGHTRQQFYMFLKCVQNLNYGYDKMDLLKSVHNKEYQDEITRRLKFCIDRHVHINS